MNVDLRPVLQRAYEFVRVTIEDRVLIVTIDRPEVRNALSPTANGELAEIFDGFFSDDRLWVAILTGAGDEAFCAGVDLRQAADGHADDLPPSGFAGLTSRRGMNKPVIAAVNGYAMGGGFEAALACHLIVADEAATFALSEVRVGMFAGGGGLVRLPRAIPEKIATELIVTGRPMDANEARDLGVVNRVVLAGTALTEAKTLAAEILRASPTSVRISLEVMEAARAISDPFTAIAATGGPAYRNLISSADADEGMSAFLAKRPPQWSNT